MKKESIFWEITDKSITAALDQCVQGNPDWKKTSMHVLSTSVRVHCAVALVKVREAASIEQQRASVYWSLEAMLYENFKTIHQVGLATQIARSYREWEDEGGIGYVELQATVDVMLPRDYEGKYQTMDIVGRGKDRCTCI